MSQPPPPLPSRSFHRSATKALLEPHRCLTKYMRVALTYVVDSKETMLRSNVFDALTEPHGNMGRVHTVVQHLGPRGASSPEPERPFQGSRVHVASTEPMASCTYSSMRPTTSVARLRLPAS
jgi:hypothetical protein